jgi:hypothetical protein
MMHLVVGDSPENQYEKTYNALHGFGQLAIRGYDGSIFTFITAPAASKKDAGLKSGQK